MSAALLIHEDGREVPVEIGQDSLQSFYGLIGCATVQLIHLADGRDMWMDEDGKVMKPLANDKATRLLHLAGGAPWDVVTGPVVITGKARGKRS